MDVTGWPTKPRARRRARDPGHPLRTLQREGSVAGENIHRTEGPSPGRVGEREAVALGGGDLWLPEATGHTHRTAQWTHVARISGQGADTPVLDEDRQDV